MQRSSRRRKPSDLSAALAATLALWSALAACAQSRPHSASLSVPDQAHYLTEQAETLYAEGKLSQAAQKLDAALKLEPDDPDAHALAAVVYHSQGAVSTALEHYWAAQRASYDGLALDANLAAVRERELLIECEAMAALLLNGERLQRKLRICLPDPRLSQVARQHSEEMRDLHYFAHESPRAGLTTITDRFRRVFGDVGAYSIAENIARRYSTGLYSLSIDGIGESHRQLMDSPGHRANILGPEFTHIGIGVGVSKNGDYWVTQFFAKL